MEMVFNDKGHYEWKLTDDNIIYKFGFSWKTRLLSELIEVNHNPSKVGKSKWSSKNGSITFAWGKGIENMDTVNYTPKEREEAEKAFEYILAHSSAERQKREKADFEKFGDVEDFYMQCDFCKHVFHYTKSDLLEDERTEKAAYRQKTMGELTSIGLSIHAGNSEVHRANEKLANIPDRNKCPKCGGEKLTRLFEEEAKAEIKKQNNPMQAVSSADELKKFKELLDMGIITQEEFDQKKKQLLGL